MREYHLQILDLDLNASDEDIKKAYRQQSKKYHPDVNPSKNATALFQKVQEAYEYLTRQEELAHTDASYYQEELSEREKWRISVWKRAKEKAIENERQRRELIDRILRYFRPFACAILVFNSLLCIDFLLPVKQQREKIVGVGKAYEGSIGSNRKPVYRYDVLRFTNFNMRFNKGEVILLKNVDEATVYSTSIFSKPMYADMLVDGAVERHFQVYNVFYVFGFLIPPLMLITALFFVLNKQIHRLNVAIISATFSVFQLFIFLSE